MCADRVPAHPSCHHHDDQGHKRQRDKVGIRGDGAEAAAPNSASQKRAALPLAERILGQVPQRGHDEILRKRLGKEILLQSTIPAKYDHGTKSSAGATSAATLKIRRGGRIAHVIP